MKIIHCGDLHLDSAMEHNLTPAQARERNAEICGTFARMVRFAAENQVEAVLIAGDLFDTRRVSLQTAEFVLNQMKNAGDVVFYYLRGNHDGADSVFAGRELPENLKCFNDRWTSYRHDSVVITGLELTEENWENMYSNLALDASDTNIVLLHGMESARPGEEQIAIPALRGKNIHYLALGHIHSHKLERLDADGVYAYCGCLEGRGFDECGEKGFILLEVTGQQIRAEFVPFARRTLHEIRVDISYLTTVTEIYAALESAAEYVDADDLVKFILTGSFTPETQKDLRFLTHMLEPRFYFLKIRDESRLKISRESYEHDISLKGEFIRMVLASGKTEEEKESIILYGLRALAGEEVAL